MKRKDIIAVFVVTGLILMVPLIAMQFTSEVDWGVGDFVGMGILISATGLAYVFATRNVKERNTKLVIGTVFLGALLAVWALLATG